MEEETASSQEKPIFLSFVVAFIVISFLFLLVCTLWYSIPHTHFFVKGFPHIRIYKKAPAIARFFCVDSHEKTAAADPFLVVRMRCGGISHSFQIPADSLGDAVHILHGLDAGNLVFIVGSVCHTP